MEVFNRLILFVFILSSLYVVRTIYFLIQSMIGEEKFYLSPTNLGMLGASIAYILTCLIRGFGL